MNIFTAHLKDPGHSIRKWHTLLPLGGRYSHSPLHPAICWSTRHDTPRKLLGGKSIDPKPPPPTSRIGLHTNIKYITHPCNITVQVTPEKVVVGESGNSAV